MRAVAVVIVALLVLASCSDANEPRAKPGESTASTPSQPVETLLIAGDIALCERPEDEATADLVEAMLKEHPDAVVGVAGDLAYDKGTDEDFDKCYDPSWGRFKDRTKPALGNHEYGTGNARGYFNYFDGKAGEFGQGWYSYDLGDWHVVVVNSNCSKVGGCGPDSEQGKWLIADLAATDKTCVLGYWHHPRWSSGAHGTDESMQPLWEIAAKGGMDVIVNGHDHHYERFAVRDGVRQFVVGTGGAWRYPVVKAEQGSEIRQSGTPGVLQLTLHEQGYRWKFLQVPNAEKSFTDEGTGSCT